MLRKAGIFILAVILSCAFFFPLKAQETISLNSLLEEALKNNPQIHAAKQRYEAAKARVKLLATLSDPRFEFEYDKITPGMIQEATGMKMEPMRTFSISQEFPFPTKLFLRRKAAQKEAASFFEEYKETERKVLKDVKENYFTLFLTDKKITLTKDVLGLLDQLTGVANARFSSGQGAQSDVLRAQVEYSRLSNELVLLQQQEKISRAMLAALLNKPEEALSGIAEDTPQQPQLTEDKIIAFAKENRPELKSFKEMVRKSEIDQALAKQEYLPDLMFKYSREAKNGKAGNWAGSFGVTFPLWFWEKQDSFVKEAKANLEVAKSEYKAEENTVLFEARSSLARFEAARNLVKIYETGVLPQAEAAYETARQGYEARKIDFLDLLDSLRTLKELQMEYFESLANSQIALADLERSVGRDLLNEVDNEK